MGYEYDIFLSYPRAGHAGEWVRNHFHPLLKGCLNEELAEAPSVWFDEDQDPGVNWPANLRRALLRSRILVAVWSPSYFRSTWCMAEWESMRAREQVLGFATEENPQGLIYPVVYGDGDSFPLAAKATQYRRDLSQWGFPLPQFQKTEQYMHLWDCMRQVAGDIATRLGTVPAWADGWPVVDMPNIAPPSRSPLPRL